MSAALSKKDIIIMYQWLRALMAPLGIIILVPLAVPCILLPESDYIITGLIIIMQPIWVWQFYLAAVLSLLTIGRPECIVHSEGHQLDHTIMNTAI